MSHITPVIPAVIAETDRLLIRPFNQHDIEAILLMNSNPDVLTYIPQSPLKSLLEAEQVFKEVIQADYNDKGFGRWAVYHKEDKKVIGFCGPKYIPEYDKVELGYRFLPEYWGQGIGTEAAKAVMNTLKPMFDIDEVIALILHGNVGSEKVAVNNGMSLYEQNIYKGHKVQVYQRML